MMAAMTLRTAFTELFSLRHPIALAPMGGYAGGALAAAVSNGGGLGLVGGGRSDPAWLDRELGIAADATGQPWGVGFLSWAIDVATVERALAYRPRAVMLSFGDPRPFIEPIRSAGAALIIQVTDLAEARQALDAGADVIVAQGTEAGGHSGGRGRSTLAFVPVVADLAAPTPVLAAGGIADGRGVAAALVLGAAGALIGTRFLATPEVLADPASTKAIIEGFGEDTERSTVLDIARGAPWPSRYPARTPSAARCSTSPGAPRGRPGTRPAPCPTRSSTNGGAGKPNSRPTPEPGAPTTRRSRRVTSPRSRCGPARPSI
jgi:nitronate monooxygenase